LFTYLMKLMQHWRPKCWPGGLIRSPG